MNSRDRVLAVLENKLSDRVPVMECAIDQKVINSICPGMSCEDFVDYAELDAVMCHTMTEDTDEVDWVDKEKRIWKDKWGALQQNTGEVISIVVPPARISTEADGYVIKHCDGNISVVLRLRRVCFQQSGIM